MHGIGNTLSNADILEFKRQGLIEISRFERTNLKLAHYRLRPGNAFAIRADRSEGRRTREFVHDFADGPYTLKAGQCILITPLERVTLSEGIVAQIRAASTLVEQGFDLTAGKLDPGYGTLGGRRQDFVMGLFNQLRRENTFFPDLGIANISFVSFREAKMLPSPWGDDEVARYSQRDLRRLRAEDDGVFYPDAEE